jgi:hypothetical protein
MCEPHQSNCVLKEKAYFSILLQIILESEKTAPPPSQKANTLDDGQAGQNMNYSD